MIYVKGSHGTSLVDGKVSSNESGGLHSSRQTKEGISGIREPKRDTQSPVIWWGGSRKDNNRQGDVQRSRLRLYDNKWF